MERAVADWWDSVELWLTQLAFPFQVLVAILVIVPLCWFAAAAVDRVVDAVTSFVRSLRVSSARVSSARVPSGRDSGRG